MKPGTRTTDGSSPLAAYAPNLDTLPLQAKDELAVQVHGRGYDEQQVDQGRHGGPESRPSAG